MSHLSKRIKTKAKLFFALSRTTHGVLDIALPAFCALLWLGAFPSLKIIILGLITVFGAYTAVYALNDLVGYRIDRAKMQGTDSYQGYSVEASDLRHPIAQKLLSVKAAVAWIGFWLLVTIIGGYLLNPITLWILLVGAVLEVIYCLLLKVTYLRVIVSGIVKACGPIAAVFVVAPTPSPYFLTMIFLWVFLWEIGGQNIPADWTDLEEDKRANSKTLPIRFGLKTSGRIVLVTLVLTIMLGAYLFYLSPAPFTLPAVIVSVLIGLYLLLMPALRLCSNTAPEFSAKLFDKSSHYPVALLVLMVVLLIVSKL